MSTKKWNDSHKEERREYNRGWCLRNKEKHNSSVKIWKKNNPHKVRLGTKRYSLKSRHNMTLEQFNHMLTEQNNRCAICNNQFKNDKDTCVDHDHETGQTRQLLCFNCNIGIGKFGDSITLLKTAVNYLEKWSE